MTLTGHVFGGGTLVANFLTDNVFGFQTFSVGAWANLVSLDIIGSSSNQGSCFLFSVCGALGYDNIVLDATVPEPAALSLLGLGLAGLYRLRRRA